MPASSQPFDLDNFLPYRLSVLAQTVSESLHDLYAGPYGLSVTQWRVMAVLGQHAPLTASEVGRRTVVDKVAVSRAVTVLTKAGLVERATDRDDRRRSLLRLSSRGLGMHSEIVALAQVYEEKLYRAFGSAQREAFDNLSERLLAHAKALRGGFPASL